MAGQWAVGLSRTNSHLLCSDCLCEKSLGEKNNSWPRWPTRVFRGRQNNKWLAAGGAHKGASCSRRPIGQLSSRPRCETKSANSSALFSCCLLASFWPPKGCIFHTATLMHFWQPLCVVAQSQSACQPTIKIRFQSASRSGAKRATNTGLQASLVRLGLARLGNGK